MKSRWMLAAIAGSTLWITHASSAPPRARRAPRARAPSKARAPNAAPRAKITRGANGTLRYDMRALPINEQHAFIRGGLDPETSAWAVSLLRSFANGKSNPLGAKLGSRRYRRAARAIVERIDRLPKAVRTAAFGSNPIDGPPSKPGKPSATNPAYGPGAPPVGLSIATDNLPAEALPLPSNYSLQATGVRTLATQDNDANGDELSVIAAYAYPFGSTFHHTIASLSGDGTIAMNAGDVHAQTAEIHALKYAGLAVSAVFEHDHGVGNLAAEFEIALGLAEAMAKQNGGNLLAGLAYALDQTAGVLSLSDADLWPPGTLTKTIVPKTGDPMALSSLYSTPKSSSNGIDYKFVHPHTIASGQYEVFFTVPDPELPAKMVTVTIKEISVLSGVDQGADQDDLHVMVSIGGYSGSKGRTLRKNLDVHKNVWTVRRPMVSSTVPIQIALYDDSTPPDDDQGGAAFANLNLPNLYPCSSMPFGCPDYTTDLDVSPARNEGTGKLGGVIEVAGPASFELDLNSGKITGDTTGDVGDVLSARGGMRGPRARVKVRITVDQINP